jgi:hypothetical protein
MALIYAITNGYPRKVVSLCHQVILMMIICGKKKAGFLLVKKSIGGIAKPVFINAKRAAVSILILVVLGFSAVTYFTKHLEADISMSKKVSTIINNSPEKLSNDNLPVAQNFEPKMPGNLGSIKVGQGSTVCKILQNVYGTASPEIVRDVLKVNPQIKDTNKISAGTMINLPAISSDHVSFKKGDLIIQIEGGKNMQNIYEAYLLNVYRQNVPAVVFLSFWNKKEAEIKFAVTINKYFNKIRDVEAEIKKLPPALAAKAIILSDWDENTVFFNRKISSH